MALAGDRPARQVAQRLGFQIVDDPIEFARKVGAAATRRKGHVVLAPVSEDTDYAVCARLCAVWLGAYLADSQAFCRKGSHGVQYEDLCHTGGAGFKVAVSRRLASEMPTLPLLLRALAEVPRSNFELYMSERTLGKVWKKAKTTKEVLRMAVLSLLPERDTADKKVQGMYRTVTAFTALHAVAKIGAGCPGKH